MKLLILSPYIPYPLTEGGKISQYAIIDYLRKIIKITLVVEVNSSNDTAYVNQLQDLWPEVHIKVIDKTLNLLSISNKAKLKSLIKKVISQKSFNSVGIQKTGIETELFMYAPKSRFFIDSVVNILEEVQPDLVQIDLLEYVDLVFCIPPTIKTVFVHHEIRFGRIESKLRTLTVLSPYEAFVSRYMQSRELSLLSRYNSIIVFSDDDQQKLLREMPQMPVYVAPFAVLDTAFKPIQKVNLKANKLVFVGGENHFPNRDAVEWYINDIAKLITDRNQLHLHIIGQWKEETIRFYKDNSNIVFAGFVDDLATYCENSIMLVPVRVGSGIRTKILYAMAYGVPVISATIGCEGIGAQNGKELLVADTPQEFADAVSKLIDDPDFTYEISLNAQQLVQAKFSQQATGDLRLNYFKEIVQN